MSRRGSHSEWIRALPLWLPLAGVLLGVVVGAIHGSDPSNDFIAFSRGAWMLMLAIAFGGVGLGLGVVLWLAMAVHGWLRRRASEREPELAHEPDGR